MPLGLYGIHLKVYNTMNSAEFNQVIGGKMRKYNNFLS